MSRHYRNYPLVLCLMGQTGTGKSSLALEVAQKLPVEIVSSDSAAIYRGLDIGTAKPSSEERKEIPHHLIDICDPIEIYSAGKFYQDASSLIQQIYEKGKIPLVVGGTMLYFHLLQRGVADMPSQDPVLRKKITLEGEARGWSFLHEKLKKIDPLAAVKIHQNDAQRIQRALELYEKSGKRPSDIYAMQKDRNQLFDFISLILTPSSNKLLHHRLDERLNKMLKSGFIEEVENLKKRKDLHIDLPAIRTVGYRQIWQYLEGVYDQEEMYKRVLIATRQLAKHQMTWLKKWKDALWLDMEDKRLVDKTLKAID